MELAGNNAKEKTQLSLVGFLAGPAQMLRHVGTKKSLNLTWWCRAPNSSTNRALEIMCAHTASRAFRSMAQLKKVLYNYNQRRIRCRRRRRRRRGELADWRETRRNAGCDVPVKIRNSSLSLSLSLERLAGCLDLTVSLEEFRKSQQVPSSSLSEGGKKKKKKEKKERIPPE